MKESTKRTTAVNADAVIARLPSDRRARVEARARRLIAEELTLRDLMRARDLTQTQLAKALGVGQEHVSRLEQRSDMLFSTLGGDVRAMGGDLKLVVMFPDQEPVALANLADVFEAEPKKPRPRKKKAPTEVAPRG